MSTIPSTNANSPYTSGTSSNASGKSTSSKTSPAVSQTPPKLSNDAYMPGTEGQLLETYTRYHPTSGGRMDFRTGTIQQGYIALTLVAGEGKGAPSTGLITEAEIDRNKPGAVFSSGKWVDVNEFLDSKTRSTGNASQTNSTKQDAAPKETYTWNLSQVDSTKIFGGDGRLYVSSMTSDDASFNPFAGSRQVDLSSLGSTRLTPLQQKQLQNNPGVMWSFDSENKAFEGHDILNAVFAKSFTNLETRERVVDEYGYSYSVPGSYDYTSEGNTVQMSPPSSKNGEKQGTSSYRKHPRKKPPRRS